MLIDYRSKWISVYRRLDRLYRVPFSREALIQRAALMRRLLIAARNAW